MLQRARELVERELRAPVNLQQAGEQNVNAEAYNIEKEYFQECKGVFNYSSSALNTKWDVCIMAPAQIKIMPKDKVALRVILTKPQLTKVYEKGEPGSYYAYRVDSDAEFMLELDNGNTISSKIEDYDEFMRFVCNN